ncbi:MAG TPA: LacI family DNA-binding transcriptional regulator [Cellulomonas sp.]
MTTEARRRRASISDVARLAGVAVGTVSNVLNRPEIVAPATRARVEAAIKEMSFVPNGVARQLRVGTITTVGVVVLDIRNPFFTDVARGVEDRLALADYTLMLASSDDDLDRERKYLQLFERHGVVGLLVVPSSHDLDHLLEIDRRGVRVVLLDAPAGGSGLSSVSVDDEAGGALAMGHLIERGHTQVVMLNGSHDIRQCAARLVGARRAAAAAGLDPDDAVHEVRLRALDSASGIEATLALTDAPGGPPPALFCVNDLVAVGVQRALRLRGGTALLESVAIVGYDDIDIASELAVPLTSVRQPTHEMGYRAADLLLAPDSAEIEQVVFAPELVVRASSAR